MDGGGSSEGRWETRARAYGAAVGVVAAAVAICLSLRGRLQTTDVAMLLLAAVVIVASRYSRGAAVIACLVAIAGFDFFFVPPYNTLAVHDSAYVLTFGVMLLVALAMSRLTARIREQADEARARERLTAALYALSREVGQAQSSAAQVEIITRHLAQAVRGRAELALAVNGELRGDAATPSPAGIFDGMAVRVAAAWAFRQGEPAGLSTSHCAEAEALALPLRTPTQVLGVAVLAPRAGGTIGPTERAMAEALAEQAAAVLERAALAERHQQARVEVEAERLRTTLLSSLSHDLRTPLGSIEGAASTLTEDSGILPPEVRRELAETVLEESRRMTRLVTNLLDMVRVETGTLAVQKSWQPLEEALGVALLRMEDRLGGRPVETGLPNDLPLVPIDELLVEQVFVNLLENASKYTPPGSPIAITAWADDGAVVVEVADHGPGVPAEQRELVFHKFHRGPRAGGGEAPGGAGLGLTICRGIVAAHGGRIWVEPRVGGGAAFRFSLPLDGPPVRAPAPEAAD